MRPEERGLVSAYLNEFRPVDRRQFLRGLAGGALAATMGGLAGCGGGGGSSNGVPGGGASGTPVTPAARAAAQQAVNDQMTNMLAAGTLTSQTAVDYLKTRPEFEAVGSVQAGGAWARFTDGELLIVSFNLPPELDTARAAYTPQFMTRATNSELPVKDQARILNALGTAFNPPHDDIRLWMIKHGYTLATGTATIESLKNVSDDGVFYINTHGDYGKLADGTEIWGMWTADKVSDALDTQYKPLLTSGAVIRFSAVHDKSFFSGDPNNPRGTFETHYAITTRFLKEFNWSFGQNSFVYMNCCWSGDGEFQNECLNRGASVYAGWSNAVVPTGAWRAARFIFDRMLGQLANGNQEYPETGGLQRAFDAKAIKADLNSRGWNVTDSAIYGQATLSFFSKPGQGDLGILAPSIQQVEVNEFDAKLILLGIFGTENNINVRFVTVGGQDLKILKWEKDRVECELPLDAYGDVQARVGIRKSNVRQLTRWDMNLRFKFTREAAPGLKVEGAIPLRFRADIGEYRTKPAETPQSTERTAIAAKGSDTTQVASGTFSDGDCTTTWKGTVKFSSAIEEPAPPTILLAHFKVDPKTKKGALGLAFGAASPNVLFTETHACKGSSTVTNPFAIAFGLLDGPTDFANPFSGANLPAIPLPALNITFNSDFGIAARSYDDPALGGSVAWDATPAKSPPDPQAARSAKL